MPTTVSRIFHPSDARRAVLDGFMPVPRGSIPIPPASLAWAAKDPVDVLDYELDVSQALRGDDEDSIETVDVAILPSNAGDLVLNSSGSAGLTVIFWFSGGRAGTVYSVQVTIGTAAGRTISRQILLPVASLSGGGNPPIALTTEAGLVVTDQSGRPILVGA